MIVLEEDLNKFPPIKIGNATDITNKKFNRLTALYRVTAPDNKKGVYWLFKCECGNYTIALAQNVIQNKIKSCGCYGKEKAGERLKIINTGKDPWNKKDLTGQQIGDWKVLRLDENGGDKNHRKWICQCSCGKIQSVFGCNLGRISFSCGHNRKSIGETKIKNLLTENNIFFETEKVMFQYDNNVKANAKFDFYVNNQYLIEYDGTTHYIPIGGWNNEESIKAQQDRDKKKNKWCLENNIPLIRIPYTHLKDLCIDDLKLETSKFIVKVQ